MGSTGRFAWKLYTKNNPFDMLVREASLLKDDWPVLRAGFFDGMYSRFVTVADGYRELLRELKPY